MNNEYRTEQESFWAGNFGDEYCRRNVGMQGPANKIIFFSNVLKHTGPIASAIEFGANIGLMLKALQQLLPSVELTAIEINPTAAKELAQISGLEVHQSSIADYIPKRTYDLAYTRGVLIHIAPDRLNDAYNCLYHSSKKYILIAEYYNPVPVEVEYRGHKGKLFKRDFAGEMMDQYSDLELVDYGFVYHRDPFPQDDITWFLMKK
jgi:pseudaminic acid biosynthesis-associated methylase